MITLQNYTKILNDAQTFFMNFFNNWFKKIEEILTKFRKQIILMLFHQQKASLGLLKCIEKVKNTS